MANKKEISKEDQRQEFDRDNIDPTLESKVDAMMNSDIPESQAAGSPAQPPEEAISAGAPLLPTEKLKKLKIFQDEMPGQNDESKDKTSKGKANQEAPDESPVDSGSAKELGMEDPETGKLIDAIVAEEADQLLAAEDARAGRDPKAPPLLAAQARPKSKLKAFFKAWWGNRLYRRLTLLAIAAGLAAAAIVPASRYFLLNSAGVRASSSMIVLDQATRQPLKNVEVSLAGQTGKTDKQGKVRLDHIKLGSQTLSIKKVAYGDLNKTLNIGWGSNPLGSVDLNPVGSRYTFSLSDFLSDMPIAKAEASSGEASAVSNDKGEVVLSVPQTDNEEVEITITAENYRREVVKIPTATKASQAVKMVPVRKAVFVSKRSGSYDVYKIDIDGKNEQKILPGTGSEQPDNMALVSHPTKEITAFVSSRGNVRGKDGFLLSTLNIINLESGNVAKIGQSERIQVIDWVGDRLVYVKIAEGASAASPQRHRLMSYDLKAEQEKELASTNYFNDVMVARGAIYYSPAIYKINGAIGLFRIEPDGSGKKTISDKEAWNLFRTSFDRISVSVGQDWYDYDIPSGKYSKASGAPPALVSRLYVGSPDDSRSLWVEDRDGKGTLLAYDHSSKEDKALHAQSGLKNPVRWLDNDHLMYRVAGGPETADYVLSLSGGQPKKIADVTNTAGTDRWYVY